jgi:hypothetical protein
METTKIKKFKWSSLLYAPWFGVTLDDVPVISRMTTIEAAATQIMSIVNWVIGLAALVAVVMTLYGGVTYITSSGESDKVKQAQGTITNALIALLILFLLRMFILFVIKLVSSNFTV